MEYKDKVISTKCAGQKTIRISCFLKKDSPNGEMFQSLKSTRSSIRVNCVLYEIVHKQEALNDKSGICPDHTTITERGPG